MGYVPAGVPMRLKLVPSVAYEMCKDKHKGNHLECETCKDRFMCWTQRIERIKPYSKYI